MQGPPHNESIIIGRQGHLLAEELQLMLNLARGMEHLAGYMDMISAIRVNTALFDLSIVVQFNLTNFNPPGYEYAEPTEE